MEEYRFKNSREAKRYLEKCGFYIAMHYEGGVIPRNPPENYPRIGTEPYPVAYLSKNGNLTLINTGKKRVKEFHKTIINGLENK